MFPQRDGDPRLRQLRDEWEGDAVYGISPVLAALSAGRRQAFALYIQEGALKTGEANDTCTAFHMIYWFLQDTSPYSRVCVQVSSCKALTDVIL